MPWFFRSESAREAIDDQARWSNNGFDDFKREVHQASNGMLDYEIARYAELFDSISLAERSSEQMRISGGRPWVNWLKKKFNHEREYVLKEIQRRSDTSHRSMLYGSLCPSLHSWEVKRLAVIEQSEELRRIMLYWKF